jgi:hypothetical protein
MNRHALAWWIGSALNVIVLLGCGSDDAGDELGTTGPSDSTNEATDGVDDDDVGESSTTNDDGGEAGSSASTTSTPDDGTDTTEGTDTNACPDIPGATDCEACVDESCCEQLMACESSESCTCMVDCVDEGATSVQCLLECGLDLPNLAYTQFTTCVQSMCASPCE